MNKYEIRQIKIEEAKEAADMEQICFAANEACPWDAVVKVVKKIPWCILVAYDKEKDKLAGLIYGLPADLDNFSDKLYAGVSKIEDIKAEGKNVFICSLEVLPEYRGEGISKKLMNELIDQKRRAGHKNIILTCHDHLIPFYNQFGFELVGKSSSTWGGEVWNEMKLEL